MFSPGISVMSICTDKAGIPCQFPARTLIFTKIVLKAIYNLWLRRKFPAFPGQFPATRRRFASFGQNLQKSQSRLEEFPAKFPAAGNRPRKNEPYSSQSRVANKTYLTERNRVFP